MAEQLISFISDYADMGHPSVWAYVEQHREGSHPGYGEDPFSALAQERILGCLGLKTDQAQVHFLTGGTQANLVAAAHMLGRPYEALIAPSSGHIVVHEAGAIAATGHGIVTCDSKDGKLTPDAINRVLAEYEGDEHMVSPKVAYVTQATELGTLYSRSELLAVTGLMKKHEGYTYLDGARLAVAVTTPNTDLTLNDIATNVDAFYLGGTKNGALFGEAMVIANPDLFEGFRHNMKQRGAMLSKGALLGQQFARLFDPEDLLWLRLGRETNDKSAALADGLKSMGAELAQEPQTNQIFVNLPNDAIERLQQKYDFYVWAPVDDKKSMIRLVCSWATKDEDIESLLQDIQNTLN